MTRTPWNRLTLVLLYLAAGVFGATTAVAVEYANIDVADDVSDPKGDNVTVTIPSGQSTSGFFLEPGADNGDYPIRIGTVATDDAAGGGTHQLRARERT